MTTPRLRHPFKYPTDDDLAAEASTLDETEQDALITSLQHQSASTDAVYVRAFTALPLVCSPAFLYVFFRPASSPSVRFLCLLALTSLGASALAMYMTPVGRDGRAKPAGVLVLPGLGEVDSDGPLGRTVPVLNPLLCALLVVASWGMWKREGRGVAVVGGRSDVPEGFWVFCLVPAVVLAVVVFVKRSILEVQGGIGELRDLKYGLKGA